MGSSSFIRTTSRRCSKSQRWSRLERRFSGTLLLCLLLLYCVGAAAQSGEFAGDPSIPEGLSCNGDCPSVGTEWLGARQTISPVSNDCTGTPLRLVLGHLGLEIELPEDECPLWVILEPDRGVPSPQQGCCLVAQSTVPVMQQLLKCECTRWFLICWDQDCLPAGEPRKISEVVSYTASPCPDQHGDEPCNNGVQ